MPIEIKELHIKVTVNASQGGTPTASAQTADSGAAPATDKDDIVAECVEQVMQIIKEKMER
jgi:Family of unknown function (DUF5908)